MDALAMEFEDDSFDMVWACESGEHMPDKKKYVEEMTRVLKPGGTIVIACWCQREEGDRCVRFCVQSLACGHHRGYNNMQHSNVESTVQVFQSQMEAFYMKACCLRVHRFRRASRQPWINAVHYLSLIHI